MQELLTIMRQLRHPETGCPWDIKQDHASLRPYLLEEAAEAVDAITEGDSQHMCEELGDVLLQIAFHAVIAEQEGTFNYADIEQTIVDKLIRRHPHVFADTEVADADEVLKNWHAIKAQEKANEETEATHQPNPADAVPRSLPALMRAQELGKKLEWSCNDAAERIQQALAENDVAALLLATVDYARSQGENAELVLRTAADRRVKSDRQAGLV